VNLFLWTYVPQAALLLIFHGPGAWVNAAVLVLGEGQVIIALLFEAFLVDETLVDIFDSVLINEGLQDFVGQARILHPDAENPAKMLGKPTKTAVYSPFSLRQIVEFVVFLPINFIPIVGVPIFLVITGYRAGPFHHWRYFKLLGLSRKERKQYIKRRQLKYTWFGTVALMLQLVPVLSMFFLLTSAAGSALWVAKMEKARRERERVSAPEDPYHDEPA
jgi:Etoposide-induced protein 2.4 (EI24)